MNEKANYGNWVPEKALYMLFGAVIVLGVIAVAVQVALSEMVIAIIVGMHFDSGNGNLYADLS